MKPKSAKTKFIQFAISIIVFVTGVAQVQAQDAGTLDETFGVGGIVTNYIYNKEAIRGSVVQADGKIIVAGYTNIDSSTYYDDFLLARYNSDGTPDISFGKEGIVFTDFGNSYDQGAAIVLQSDGKIIVAGTTGKPDSLNKDFALARYNTDGTLDTTFGQGGRVITDFAKSADFGAAVAVQKTGKILIAGTTENLETLQFDYAIVRYDTLGKVDSLFSDRGRVRVDFKSRDDVCNAIALLEDDRIVVAGLTIKASPGSDFSIARINTDGTFDQSFGDSGKTTIDVKKYDYGNALAVTAVADKVLLAGTVSDGGDLVKFCVIRLKTDGTLDFSFGEKGQVLIAIGPKSYCNAIATQADNKIVLAGRTLSNIDVASFAMKRLNEDGGVDSAFGFDGQAITKFDGTNAAVYSINLQSDGKIILAGDTFDPSMTIAIARYYGETVLPLRIVSLSAEKNNQTVVLKWQAASESAGSSFTVERSTNGASFSSLGMVKASTTSTSLHAYSFVDNAPAGGMNYYRLKVADGSSKIFYTNIVAVDYSLAESIRIFPNPVHDVLFVKGISPDARAEIADASGKTVLQTQMNAGNSIQLQHLQKGLYFLRITDGGKTTVLKFMKE